MKFKDLKDILEDRYILSDLWFTDSLFKTLLESKPGNSAYDKNDRTYIINEPHDKSSTFCIICSAKTWDLYKSAFRLFVLEYNLEFVIGSLESDHFIHTYYLDIEND